jgi:large subunit ribosomal protein L28
MRAEMGTEPVAICVVTGKRTVFGRNIRHKHTGRWQRKAHKTSRTFKPNLQKKTVIIDGEKVRVTISARGLRTLTKNMT